MFGETSEKQDIELFFHICIITKIEYNWKNMISGQQDWNEFCPLKIVRCDQRIPFDWAQIVQLNPSC